MTIDHILLTCIFFPVKLRSVQGFLSLALRDLDLTLDVIAVRRCNESTRESHPETNSFKSVTLSPYTFQNAKIKNSNAENIFENITDA